MRMLWLLRAAVLVSGLSLVSAAEASAVDLRAADGTLVKATDYGTGAHGVVLVHDKGRTGADWGYFAEKLAADGFHVVVLDLRGHGASKPPETLAEADYPKMVQDVSAAVGWLRAKGAKEVAVVGASFGANLALHAAADDPSIATLVLLSPGLNLSGVSVGQAMERYGARPVLMVASSDDAYAIRSVNFLEEKAKGDKHVEVLESAGSGVKMLNRDPSLEATLLSWLNGSFFLQPGRSKPQTLSTGDNTAIETSGKRFGE